MASDRTARWGGCRRLAAAVAATVLASACGAADDDDEAAARRDEPTVAITATATTAPTAPATPTTVTVDPAAFLDEVEAVVREQAYYADDVDWAAWEASVADVLPAASRPSDTYGAVEALVDDLDPHSSFEPTAPPAPVAATGPDRLHESQEPTGAVDAGVGHLALTRAVSWDPEQAAGADYVRAAWALLEEPACGWVVDLRGGGGNAWTLAMALAPLLGPGPAFGWAGPDGAVDMVTVGRDGSIAGGGRPPLAAPEGATVPSGRADVPVAVVQGSVTASAHEFALLGFLGRPATRTFGAPTYGVPTAIEQFVLRNGSALMLATSIGVDRTGGTHEGQIPPDTPVAEDDAALAAARDWVATRPACA